MLLGEGLQRPGEPGERGLGSVRRRERDGRDIGDPAAWKHDTDVGMSAAELGRDREPLAAAEAQDLARTAPGGGPRALLRHQPMGDELADRERDRRRCGTEQLGELGAGARLPGGE